MSDFIEVEITTGEEQLANEARTRLIELVEASGITGFELPEAKIESILIGVLSGMAANAAQVAAVVPSAIFREYGKQLIKLQANEGAAATASTKWTISPEATVRHIEAGVTIEAGGKGFYVETETEVPASATSVTLQVVAVERGTEYNKIEGVAQQTNPINFVTEVQIVGETSGGANEETDEEYLSRLATALTLQAPRPITAENYAAFVLDVPGTVVPSGVVVGRATSIDGYNPAENTFTGTTKSSSTTLETVSSFTGITPGTELVGTSIPSGTTVISINTGAKTLVMSAAAEAAHTSESIKGIGSFENERTVTTFVTDKQGKALTSEAMSDIETWLKGYREINFNTYVRGPSINTIYVTTKIHVLPEYTASTVEANVKSAVEAFLNPATWGNPTASTTGSTQWLNYVNGVHLYGIVRYNQLIEVIGAVPGVAYVFSGSTGLKVGKTATPTETVDVVLSGPAPLPQATEATIVVTSG